MDDPQLKWRRHRTGLLIPQGIEYEGNFYPSSTSDLTTQIRRHLLETSFGVIPSFKDLWPESTESTDDILNALSRDEWLGTLCRLSVTATSELVSRDDLQRLLASFLGKVARTRFETFPSIPSKLLAFPFLISMAGVIVAARHSGKLPIVRPRNEHPFESVVKLLVRLHDELSPRFSEDKQLDSAGTASTLCERSEWSIPSDVVDRAFGVWLWLHPGVIASTRQRRGRFAATFRNCRQIELAHYVLVVTFWTYWLVTRPMSALGAGVPFLPRIMAGAKPDIQMAVDRIADSLSQDIDAFACSCRAIDAQVSLLERPSLYPIAEKPLLRVPTAPMLAPLSVSHLACKGLFEPRDSCKSHHHEWVGADFGDLLEDYVHGLLSLVFGQRYQRLKPSQAPRADGLILYPNGCIIVEVKGRRISESRRYQIRTENDLNGQLDNLDRPKAVRQIKSTTADVIAGKISTGLRNLSVVGSIIVVGDVVPLNVTSENIMNKILPRSDRTRSPLVLQPQILSLQEIEYLDQWRSATLLDLLEAKMREPNIALQPLTVYLRTLKIRPEPSVLKQTIRNDITAMVHQVFRSPE